LLAWAVQLTALALSKQVGLGSTIGVTGATVQHSAGVHGSAAQTMAAGVLLRLFVWLEQLNATGEPRPGVVSAQVNGAASVQPCGPQTIEQLPVTEEAGARTVQHSTAVHPTVAQPIDDASALRELYDVLQS
jgi:hypothetical protein